VGPAAARPGERYDAGIERLVDVAHLLDAVYGRLRCEY
jgi:hypothetical protein